jgi:CRISPR/Cas system CSM-associated protein Csm3 (group 7 of RAMP superfamily)
VTDGSFLALSDPGGVRPVVTRWTITGELILETATHFGGDVGDVADMVLIRDSRTGGPVLAGTSIAGALRSHLADVLGGYRSREDMRVAHLFGTARGDDLGTQSPLIVFDSLGMLPDRHTVEIRDGVQIDAKLGTAEEHKKFDLEVLPAGTSFPIRFDLVVSKPDDETELLTLLVAALAGLSDGEIALGARRSRGLGAVHAAKWQATRLDLSSREGWITWLLADGSAPSAERGGQVNDVREACVQALGESALAEVQDCRRRLLINAEITSIGGLLVRSVPAVPDAPDVAHLRSAGRSVLPGTAVAGVLRKQALRIAHVVRGEKSDAEKWVERLFGPRMAGVVDVERRELRASKLRITESLVEGGRRSRPSRVRIDRFTQGVVPAALFDEEPEYGGRVSLRFELRDPASGELGLVLLVLKDLLTGELAVGGTSSVGRGRFEGTATLRLEDGRRMDLDPAKSPDPVVEQAIEQLWSAPILGGDR